MILGTIIFLALLGFLISGYTTKEARGTKQEFHISTGAEPIIGGAGPIAAGRTYVTVKAVGSGAAAGRNSYVAITGRDVQDDSEVFGVGEGAPYDQHLPHGVATMTTLVVATDDTLCIHASN